MADQWMRLLTSWLDAGLIDEATAARIRAFEQGRSGAARWRWPMWIALGFGALMSGAGILLFVSSYWDAFSPAMRFTIVVASVGLFHVAGAAMSNRAPALATALHAIGTVACGAGIFLTGQIFNLAEHWPAGLLLWAGGAAIGWALLRDRPHLALLALLGPAWLSSEWVMATEGNPHAAQQVVTVGWFLLSIAYFTGVSRDRTEGSRGVLLWVGGIALLPAALGLALAAAFSREVTGPTMLPVSSGVRGLGWLFAVGGPSVLAVLLRRAGAWPNLVAAVWAVILVTLGDTIGGAALHAWWAVGAAAFVAWGVRDGRRERIDMGSALFAAAVVSFYFSTVMTKLGRSASLIGLGVLFLAGGWALERTRRELVRHTKGDQA